VQADPRRPQPSLDLAGGAGGHASWSGRWALVDGDELTTDAAGLIGCHYRHGQDGELWVASSAALLCEIPGLPTLRPDSPPPAFGHGMDWCPPPSSRVPGIARLLPTQRLRLEGTAGAVARDIRGGIDPGRPYDETLHRLAELLTGAVSALADIGGPVWLPLSAGYDSRLLLAACDAAGIAFTTYTFTRPRRLMSAADRTMPPRLARLVGVPHRRIRWRNADPAARDTWDRHTLGHSMDIDREYFARAMWEAIPANATVLRGGVFETARSLYWSRLPADPGSSAGRLEALQRAFRVEQFHQGSEMHRRGLAEWAAWTDAAPMPHVDWRDRFYLEQRVAGWLGAIEHGLDVTDVGCRVNVADNEAMLATLLSVPPDLRLTGRHHLDLIRTLSPRLLELPFNPETRFQRAAHTARALSGRARARFGR
jgi:hypothetical protein